MQVETTHLHIQALWMHKTEKVTLIRSPAVDEIADRTGYLDNNTVPCSWQHKKNGHVINKVRYNK